ADGLVGDGFGDAELTFGDHLGDHRCFDGARADGVDPDAAWRVFQCGAAGEADHAVLGRVVGGSAGQSYQASEGGAVHDRAGALVAHLAQFVLHAGPYAAEVDRVHAVAGLGGFVGGVG